MQVVILGMHRSGTSILTRLIAMNGFYIGPEYSSTGSSHQNLSGFLERKDVRLINDKLLKQNGYDWDCLEKFSISRFSTLSIDFFLKELREIINEIDLKGAWVLKEPRFSLYPELVDRVVSNPFYIHLVRKPDEVCNSLLKRNMFDYSLSSALWIEYNYQICEFLKERNNFLTISYESLMEDPKSVLKKIQVALTKYYSVEQKFWNFEKVAGLIKPADHFENSEHIEIDPILNTLYDKIVSNNYKDIFWAEVPNYLKVILKYHHNSRKRTIENEELLSLEHRITYLFQQLSSKEILDLGIKNQIRDVFRDGEKAKNFEYVLNRLVLLEKTANRSFSRLETELEQLKGDSKSYNLKSQKTLSEALSLLRKKDSSPSRNGHLTAPFVRLFNVRTYITNLFTIISVLGIFTRKIFTRPISIFRNLKISHISILFKALQNEDRRTIIQNAQNYFNKRPKSFYALKDNALVSNAFHKRISVYQGFHAVIPIYSINSEVLKATEYSCFQLERSIFCKKILIIDDSDSEQNVLDFCKKLAQSYTKLEFHVNKKNLGYTASVNAGIKLVNSSNPNDILILNSDAILGPNSVTELVYEMLSDDEIGTVTPLSNNAGPFSVESKIDLSKEDFLNFWKNWLFFYKATKQPSRTNGRIENAPTGHGFCLLIREELLNKVGLFDETLFPIGYGEENDFCQRALIEGYRNSIAWKSLVLHFGSSSFGERKAQMVKKARLIIDGIYPNYKSDIGKYFGSAFFLQKMKEVNNLLVDVESSINILYLLSSRTGGTPQTSRDLASNLSKEFNPYFLFCDTKEIILEDLNGPLQSWMLNSPIELKSHTSKEYDELFVELLMKRSIDIVHVRHIAWHSFDLLESAHNLGVRVIFSCHDFYTICPTVNLLDTTDTYCAGNCNNSIESTDCQMPIWSSDVSVKRLKNDFVFKWRELVERKFSYVDHWIFTSNQSQKLISNFYPRIKDNSSVIPHGRSFKLQIKPTYSLRISGIRLLFLGNIGPSKGSNIIEKLIDYNDDHFEFHFLGRVKSNLSDKGIHHGKYNRENVVELIDSIQPDFVCLFSTWPETFCHTLTESWTAGVPVITFGLGAIEERIKKHGGGFIVDRTNVDVLYDKLIALSRDKESYSELCKKIEIWQDSKTKNSELKQMSLRYENVYLNKLYGSKIFQELSDKSEFN